jgi:exonuclease III
MDPSIHPTGDQVGAQAGMTTILSANVHALAPRVGEVAEWDADIVMLQETKLAAHSVKDSSAVLGDAGWTFVHGRPCRVVKRSKKETSSAAGAATEGASGGVAIMVKKPRRDLGHKFDEDELALHSTGRWTRVCTSLKKGR